MLTWSQIVTTAARELALSGVTPAVASANDPLTQQLGALANRCGQMVADSSAWVGLTMQGIVEVAPPIVLTGTVTQGSAVVTGLSSTAGLIAGRYAVSGTYLTEATRLLTVDSATQITLDQVATASGSATLTFALDTYDVPADFRSFISRTFWDRSRQWELIGPMSPQEDQWMRSGIVATGPRRRFRKIGRGRAVFRIWPPPTDLDSPATLGYEYTSEYWAQDANDVPKAMFTQDTDTCVFRDDVMVLGLKWLFLQAKGFEYESFKRMWEAELGTAMAQDTGARTLSLVQRPWPVLIGPGNVQDADFPPG
jgi:hypothetical protein